MGARNAEEMAAAAGEGEVSMRMALTWQLQANHFPSVHTIFVDTAMQAIRLVADEEFDTEIELPNGLTKSAVSIVEELHLWPFVDHADALPPEEEEELPVVTVTPSSGWPETDLIYQGRTYRYQGHLTWSKEES